MDTFHSGLPLSLGTVNQLKHTKMAIHRRLATLSTAKEFNDDTVLETLDIIQRKNEEKRTEATESCKRFIYINVSNSLHM